MPHEMITFISDYGYTAIFILVFSQEIGIPNPVPNELVLLLSGYLSFKGVLFFPAIILTAVAADITGTSLLYFTFYFFGKYILSNKPRWLPVSTKRINKLGVKIGSGRLWVIFLCRITPFIRGYTSVISGLLQIKPGLFMPVAFLSAATWSTVCIITGRLLAPHLFSGV